MAKKKQIQNPPQTKKSPTRKQVWRQLSNEITAFSLIDPKLKNLRIVEKRRESLLQELKSAGIGEGSHLHKILNDVYRKFQEYFETHPIEEPQRSEFEEKKTYKGMIQTSDVRYAAMVKVHNSSITISRGYHHNKAYGIKPDEVVYVTWNFNPAGRISIIQTFTYPTKKRSYEIMRVIHEQNYPLYWKSAEAKLKQIPLEARIAIEEVEENMPFKRHCGLIKAGHTLASHIFENAKSSSNDEEPKPRYTPLSEIVNDNFVTPILRLAKSLTPTLTQSKKQKNYVINY